MKLVRWIPAFAGMTLLASCHGIGSGSTLQSIKIVYFGASGEQGALLTPANSAVTEDTIKMYDCLCSTVKVYGYFTDGTVGDFTSRVSLKSSDPAIVDVKRFDVAQPCAFAQNDPLLWTLVPKGQTGNVTLDAEFLGLKASIKVRVDTAQDPSLYSLSLFDPTATGITVGTNMGLVLKANLDNFQRDVTANVVGTVGNTSGWTLTGPDADDSHVVITKTGILQALAATVDGPVGVVPMFGACPSFNPLASSPFTVGIGDILGPLTLSEEDNFYPVPPGSDQMLAVETTELLKVTAALDFDHDGTADGMQTVSPNVSLIYTDACTQRTYLAGGDGSSTVTDCAEAAATCDNTVPVCNSGQTSCAPGGAACRTTASTVSTGLFNSVKAVSDGPAVDFFARFPTGTPPDATTLSAGVDASATTLTLASTSGFPTFFPYFAVIDSAGTREDVRVTAASGTTLTVVRGQGGFAAAPHASGDSFELRTYSSATPLPITPKAGTLTAVALDSPGTVPAGGQLQFQATGTFNDGSTDRFQHVTHQAGTTTKPGVVWRSSDTTVATVTPTGGLVNSSTICGGRAVLRVRGTQSTDTVDNAFATTITTTDTDANGNDDANDTACASDALCDQTTLCIETPATLPEGASCSKTAHFYSGTGTCVVCTAPDHYDSGTGTCVP